MTYMIAENYMGLRKYDLAAQWYENAEKVNYAEAHPELLLKLADAYKGTCRYDEALKRYNEYLKRVPNDKAALNGAKACELAVEWEKKPTRYEVTNVVMLNTANDDAAPIFMNKKKYNQILFLLEIGLKEKVIKLGPLAKKLQVLRLSSIEFS